MFSYQDPTGTDCLKRQGALETYRGKLHTQYETAAQVADTNFVPVRVFGGLQPSGQPDRVITLMPGATFSNAIVPWNAFPRRKQSVDNLKVDSERTLQGTATLICHLAR